MLASAEGVFYTVMMMEQPLRIGTRGSPLALKQTDMVMDKLRELGLSNFEVIPIKTTGDKIQDTPLYDMGGKALFAKELEQALLDHRIDCAVHSLKDLEHQLPLGLTLTAFLEREDPRDVLISKDHKRIEEMPETAVIGTCSPRRMALLMDINPALNLVPLRGNVASRLEKVKTGELDGVILALAGLRRLGLESEISHTFSLEDFTPAAGQGAIAIETRADDDRVNAIIGKLNHSQTAECVTLERKVLEKIQGNCRTPIAAYAQLEKDGIVSLRVALERDGLLRRALVRGQDRESLVDQAVEQLLK